MRVLVACEFSGIVRDAFAALGHDAWSCDILSSERPGNHIQADVRTILTGHPEDGEYDILIAHPPCTYLCNSGVRWLAPGGQLDQERYAMMREACDFFALLYQAPVPRVAVENPVMHRYAREYLARVHGVPGHSVTLQPWQHGEPEVKRTCLWLRGLPSITPSNVVPGRNPRVHFASPGKDRWKERSRTLPGIAKAMADQWGRTSKEAPHEA